MPDVDIDTALDWRGRTVVDRHGKKIGTFDELFLDEDDRPAWAAVTTGLFGRRQTFVPLSQAERVGDHLRVPYDEQAVKDAPSIDPSEQLSGDEETVLYEHYGLRSAGRLSEDSDVGSPAQVGDDQGGAVAAQATTAESDTEAEGLGEERATAPTEDPDTSQAGMVEAPGPESAPARDVERDAPRDAMTRSEEEVIVGTRTRERGRARLKKYVVTDHVQKTVPVRREEVRVEFEPAGDDSDAGTDQDAPRQP